jgi:hypothetical protein
MDGETFRNLATGVQIVMLFALAGYTFIGDKDKVTVSRLTLLETTFTDKYEEHGERLSRVEAEVVGHPTHKDIAALYESINTLAATVNQLVGETRLQSDLMRMLINREVHK